MKAEQDFHPEPLSSSRQAADSTTNSDKDDLAVDTNVNHYVPVPPVRSFRDAPPSDPLGQVNAARRPWASADRPVASISAGSGLNPDIVDRIKNFSLSRSRAPPPANPSHTVSTSSVPTSRGAPITGSDAPGLAAARHPSAPNVHLGTAMSGRLPNKQWGNNSSTSPSIPGLGAAGVTTGAAARVPSKPGGLAAKRAKPGLKLPDPNGQSAGTAGSVTGESAFSKYSEFIDTKSGTLNFKNKAVLHGGGVEFSSGQTFRISLDEVDRLEELGTGNYGSVYKVRHSRPHLRKPGLGLRGIVSRPEGSSNGTTMKAQDNGLSGAIMAMKEIRLELDESKLAQIIMELDILHRCVSPFIIDFYGAFFQEGAVYICVEYMDGGSIDNLYSSGIPEHVLRKVTISTIMGLKALKDDHNIIHRDVKPTNILVNTRGQVKICDFGVSGNLVSSIAKTNIGCQSYMAPERIAGGGMQQSGAPGNGTYSVQSDVWSLGLSVIECAIGRYPYPPETFGNIFSQLHSIVHGDPPTLPESGYSNEAHSFVKACLNKVPHNRPSYNNLLRHPWLAPLMQRPEAYVNGEESAHDLDNQTSTQDKEVADWVNERLGRCKEGLQHDAKKKPALHAVALDTIPGSPLLDEPSSINPK